MAIEPRTRPEEILQLLDEHHLVVLSDHPPRREEFVRALISYLGQMTGVELVVIDGSRATDLASFCRQLARSLPRQHHVEPDHAGMVEVLRQWPTTPKYRYILWSEAHAMLEEDVRLFSRLVNALNAVAAEFEHLGTSDEVRPLVLQRTIYVGESKLGAYAEDETGQFCRWLDEDSHDHALFWEVMSCVDAPPVLTLRLDG